MFRFVINCFLALVLSVSVVQAKDLALIIGINEYTNLPNLNKALEDATGYSELFSAKGFEVHFLENPTSGTMRVELAQFYDRIEEGDTVVFIYSGHGWSDGSLNFLVPSDTPDISSTTIAAELSIPLKNGVNGVLDRISAQGAKLTVAVVDACRNNPFSGAETRALGVLGGLAPVEPPSGTFIVYSAASNQTALDRLGEADTQQYSVFTRFFLPNLRDMGDLRTAIVETRGQVRVAAGIIDHRQRPAYYDELTGTSCLFGDCGASAQPIVVAEVEGQAAATWSIIQQSTDPIILGAFVERFSDSDPEYANLARSILLDLPSPDTPNVAAENEAPAASVENNAPDATDVSTTSEETAEDNTSETTTERQTGFFAPLPSDNAETLKAGGSVPSAAALAQIEAIRRIALSDGISLDLSGITDLSDLPAELSALTELEYLDISRTGVSDLALAYMLPRLNEPNVAGSPLSNMRVSAEENLTLAESYHYGEGVEVNGELAILHYTLAFDQYDWGGYAAYQLGYIYGQAEAGIDEDEQAEFDFMTIAVERDRSGDAAEYLADLYEMGTGTAQDYDESARLIIYSLTRGSEQPLERLEWGGYYDAHVVSRIQSTLAEMGLYNGVIDGDMGPNTQAAMIALCECRFTAPPVSEVKDIADEGPATEAESIALAEAIRRIAAHNGNSLDLSGLTDLAVLPVEISALVDLEYLDISNTNISDLSLAYVLPRLNEPNVVGSPLSDLRVLAEENIKLGENYHYGEGVDVNGGLAISHYSLAFDQYDWGGYAAYQLGYIFGQGEAGISQDDVRAFNYITDAVERDRSGNAAEYLSDFYEMGKGTAVDYDESARLIIHSLTQGSYNPLERLEWGGYYDSQVVTRIQSALTEMGFYNGVIDGDMGPNTQAAMIALCECG